MATSQPRLNGHENEVDHSPDHGISNLSLSSKSIHADDYLNIGQDVAPPLHVSTTFRCNRDPNALRSSTEPKLTEQTPISDAHIYSRYTAPNTTRFEAILSQILKGPALTYSSGLSAFHALLTYLNPKRISFGEGYHGCHGVIKIHQKLTGLKVLDLHCDPLELEPGDMVHVETPLNPTGYAYNLKEFAEKAHKRGAFLTVDATFGPPPLQDPFAWGADIVMHSGTKYVGGHSDMLCGILAVNPKRVEEGWFEGLFQERQFLGNVMGGLESWLGIRSLRTLEIRVERQAKNASLLVDWLHSSLISESTDGDDGVIKQVLAKIEHASLQEEDIEDGWLLEQMPNGFGPVFSITMRVKEQARRLPSKLALFHHATSLGGVESLIEWRTMTDNKVDQRLLRVSVGIEGWEDLRDDLMRGFRALYEERENGENGESS